MLRGLGMAILLLATAAPPAAADWLVMADGTRVETRGPWRQDGRLIVFTSADDRLVSLRASSVDLAASVEATRRAAEATAEASEGGERAEAPPEPRREVRRITNADVGPGQPPAPQPGAEGAAGEPAEPAAPPGSGALDIVDSRQATDETDGHLIVTGSVVNRSAETAAAVAVTVLAYGADGELLGSQRATLGAEALPPGEGTSFEVEFPEVFAAFALRFIPEASFLQAVPEREALGNEIR